MGVSGAGPVVYTGWKWWFFQEPHLGSHATSGCSSQNVQPRLEREGVGPPEIRGNFMTRLQEPLNLRTYQHLHLVPEEAGKQASSLFPEFSPQEGL